MSPHERRAVLRLVVLAVAVGALFAAVALSGDGLSSARLRDALEGAGWIGPLAFVAVSAALTVACVPGPLLAGAAGLLFGTALGTPTAVVAATLGASAAFLVSRRLGGGAVAELSGRRRIGAMQDWIAARGFLAVLYARILPLVPYTLVNYAAGLTRVRLVAFAGATAIGCAPRAFAYAALGGSLGDLSSPDAIAAYAVLAAMALLSVPFALRRFGSGTGSSSPADRSAGPP